MATPTPFPGVYADVLWNTNILPIIPGVTKTATGSIDGIATTPFANPTTDAQMISRINSLIAATCYSAEGYDCLQNTYGGITYNNIPARYVWMGAGNAADQLIVTAPGVYQYIPTDIRYPPNYPPL